MKLNLKKQHYTKTECSFVFQLHLNVSLQIAATFCISNLVWNEEEGSIYLSSFLASSKIIYFFKNPFSAGMHKLFRFID